MVVCIERVHINGLSKLIRLKKEELILLIVWARTKGIFVIKRCRYQVGVWKAGVVLCYFLGDKGNIWKLGYFANVSYY